MSDEATCKRPPPGWSCSRAAGHAGPCAAHPDSQEDAQLEANLRSIRAALNGEQARVKFIHETARQLFLKGVVADEHAKDRSDGLPGRGIIKGADAAWFLARKLWDAKPEDC
jgi:hypothetical protein